MYLGLVLLALALGACTAAMDDDVQKLDASRETLRTRLAAHQSDPQACQADQAMLAADPRKP